MLEKYKKLVFYVLSIIFAVLVIYLVIELGIGNLEGQKVLEPVFAIQNQQNHFEQFWDAFYPNLTNPLSIFILQILIIIITARLFSYISNKIGQPSVIGEIFAGIFLGPSLLGSIFPEFSSFLFPIESLGNLKFLSQVGLILFMFVVGMELDLKVLRTKAHEAVVISHMSIVVPFMLGTGLAYFVYLDYAPAGTAFLPFALFMGIAMSITAFPVLARIIQERELTRTPLGALIITCAAADDISAWCIFAAVVAIVKAGTLVGAGYTILLAVLYVIIMIKVVRPFLARFGKVCSSKESMNKGVVAMIFFILLLSSYATEIIGIHAIFGAFMAGVIMPQSINFRKVFAEKIEDVSLLLFLPLFFVFTGLRTQVSLLGDSTSWQVCGLIILVAVVGKFVGSTLAAKFVGQNWRNSIIIGSLMNTRGLMELIILNIGFDLGILSPDIFAMMVIMALTTTSMAGPVLDLVDWLLPDRTLDDMVDIKPNNIPKNKVLISFADSDKGRVMLDIAKTIWGINNASYTAIHILPSDEVHQYDFEDDRSDRFTPIKEQANHLGIRLNTILKVSQQKISKEVAKQADQGNYDFLMIGIGSSIYKDTLLGKLISTSIHIINPEKLIETFTKKDELLNSELVGDRTKYLIAESNCCTGIFFNKEFKSARKILIITLSVADSSLLTFAGRILSNDSKVEVTVLDAANLLSQSAEFSKEIEAFKVLSPKSANVSSSNNPDQAFFMEYDLMIISYDSWKKCVNDTKNVWLAYAPSTLIIKPAKSRK